MNFGKFNDTQIGSTYNFTVLITEMTERISKTDKPYVAFTFSDGTDKVSMNFFDKTEAGMKALGLDVGKVVDLTFSVKTYQNKKNFIVENISICNNPEAKVEKFVQSPPYDIDDMYKKIIDSIKKATGRDYDCSTLDVPADDYSAAALTIRILNKNRVAFCKSSAAHSIHHDIRGGLIYHTFRMVYSAFYLAKVYKNINLEILMCGTALHDIASTKRSTVHGAGSEIRAPTAIPIPTYGQARPIPIRSGLSITRELIFTAALTRTASSSPWKAAVRRKRQEMAIPVTEMFFPSPG